MVFDLEKRRFRHWSSRFLTFGGLMGLVLLLGCPNVNPPPPDEDDGGEPPPTDPTARLISPSTSFGLSLLDPSISVIYSLPTEATGVSGYYQQVSGGANPQPIGDRVVIATGLPAGPSEFFEFSPQTAGVGFFRVGVQYTLDGEQLGIESTAVIQVQGSPDPAFVLPDQARTSVEQGDEVLVTFDAGDPENMVQWRLFLLADGDSESEPADRLGTQLSIGSGNEGTFRVNTTSLVPGDYQLGLSATDSGFSVTGTVSRGLENRIVTIPNDAVSTPVIRVVPPDVLEPPTLVVTAPAAPGVELFQNDPFMIRFEGHVFETGGTREIEVFRDNDNNFANGVTIMGDNLPVTQTSFALPTNLPEGVYSIGVTIRDGVTMPLTVYASGRITVIRTVTLAVTQPTSPLPVPPGTLVNVAWTTNAPDNAGTVDAFAQIVDNTGSPFGPELPLTPPVNDAELSRTTAQFTSNAPGRFLISVRINVRDGTFVVRQAPVVIRFSSLPGIVWLGSLADPDGEIEGAIFGGANFEDNAGSGLTTAGNLDGAAGDEFVIASRYGKPFFVNPTGVGPGEAYIVYGAAGNNKPRGEFNLNSVGTQVLKGITLPGLRVLGDTDDTDGMSDVTVIPDADLDGRPELVFSFPETDSIGWPFWDIPMARYGQFRRGGIVILSSQNDQFEAPLSSPVIFLDIVGQRFSDETITPTDRNLVIADQFQFEEGDPDADPPVASGCIEGSDSFADSIVGPNFGFISVLACPRWEWADIWAVETDPIFVCILSADGTIGGGLPPVCGAPCLPAQAPAEEACPTVYDIPLNETCRFSGGGSGFFPSTAVPLAPRGARVIGKGVDDKFGTSVSASNAVNTTFGDLIISAPGRAATDLEVNLLGDDEVPGSGVAYLVNNLDRWAGLFPATSFPSPHQYMVDTGSHCGDGRTAGSPAGPKIAGQMNDMIQIIEGIEDFNSDGRNDFAIGAPNADSDRGRVYIAYRRDEQIEGDYVLRKLGLSPNNNERLTGLLLRTTTTKNFGFSLASGFDFNGDGHSDMVIGSPRANGGVGEVLVLFGSTGIISPLSGYTDEALLSDIRTRQGRPVAARIQGNPIDLGLFGFNVANAGDVDGDGTDDLLVAAPHATPRFDPNPNDDVDELTAKGVDLDLDGVADDVNNRPGGDTLDQAGLVYVVYGNNRLDRIKECANSGDLCDDNDDCDMGEACITTNVTINIDRLGTNQLKGFIVAGRRGGDRLGGGDAGDSTNGGISEKQDRGRSFGLASAGDVDADGRADILIGAVLADPRRDPTTDVGEQNGGEAYLLYGTAAP